MGRLRGRCPSLRSWGGNDRRNVSEAGAGEAERIENEMCWERLVTFPGASQDLWGLGKELLLCLIKL